MISYLMRVRNKQTTSPQQTVRHTREIGTYQHRHDLLLRRLIRQDKEKFHLEIVGTARHTREWKSPRRFFFHVA